MPEDATTHVWITVFSWRVNGCMSIPILANTLVHICTKKNPNNPADMFNDGIIPVVKLSFMTMNVNNTANTKLTTIALTVICFSHRGTTFPSNAFSTDVSSTSSSLLAETILFVVFSPSPLSLLLLSNYDIDFFFFLLLLCIIWNTDTHVTPLVSHNILPLTFTLYVYMHVFLVITAFHNFVIMLKALNIYTIY